MPRIEQQSSKEEKEKSKAAKRFPSKVPQKPNIRPQNFGDGAVQQTERHSTLNKNMWMIRGQLFHRGFVYKNFAYKQLEVGPNVKPSFEELQMFKSTLANSSLEDVD